MYAIGNVKERGHNLAKLFRMYADIIDERTASGNVEVIVPEDKAIN